MAERYLLNLEDPNQCWFRLPHEPTKAYTAFCVYRDLDVYTRSMAKAYRRYRNLPESNSSGPSGTWTEWSIRFRWRERAAAYDKHRDEAQLEAEAKEDEDKERLEMLNEQKLDLEDSD